MAKHSTFSEARNAFVKALNDYQSATRDMSLALVRFSEQTTSFYRTLNNVVNTSGGMLTPRH